MHDDIQQEKQDALSATPGPHRFDSQGSRNVLNAYDRTIDHGLVVRLVYDYHAALTKSHSSAIDRLDQQRPCHMSFGLPGTEN